MKSPKYTSDANSSHFWIYLVEKKLHTFLEIFFFFLKKNKNKNDKKITENYGKCTQNYGKLWKITENVQKIMENVSKWKKIKKKSRNCFR